MNICRNGTLRRIGDESASMRVREGTEDKPPRHHKDEGGRTHLRAVLNTWDSPALKQIADELDIDLALSYCKWLCLASSRSARLQSNFFCVALNRVYGD